MRNVFPIIVLSVGHIGQMFFKTPGCRINHTVPALCYWHEHTKNLPIDTSIQKRMLDKGRRNIFICCPFYFFYKGCPQKCIFRNATLFVLVSRKLSLPYLKLLGIWWFFGIWGSGEFLTIVLYKCKCIYKWEIHAEFFSPSFKVWLWWLSKVEAGSNMDAWALVNAGAEVPFLTDDRVCMLVRVLLDNNVGKVPFLTAGRVCTVGRVLCDIAYMLFLEGPSPLKSV